MLSRPVRRRAAEGDGRRTDNGGRAAIWALRDVSFEVRRGEVVGVVGRNGAGKSTLLKVLSRITRPTEGRAVISGRVGSLLEVGTGFHPELTGRENVFLNGAILGMGRREIEHKFDEIVGFAEIERFLDTPVKRYSSGMYVRLAFSVAAHLDPEILIVDEVLSVGDAAFQRRCMGKIGGAAREGRTVLFVSHNMHAVATLCGSALWLEKGEIRSVGPAGQLTAAYLAEMLQKPAQLDVGSAAAEGPVTVRSVRMVDQAGRPVQHVNVTEPFALEAEYSQCDLERPVRFVFRLSSALDGSTVLMTTDWDHGAPTTSLEAGTFVVRCEIPGNFLNRGMYNLYLHVDEPHRRFLQILDDVGTVSVVGSPEQGDGVSGERDGHLSPYRQWSVRRVGRD